MHTLPIAVTKAAFSHIVEISGWRIVPAEEGYSEAAAIVAAPEEIEAWRPRASGRPVLAYTVPARSAG